MENSKKKQNLAKGTLIATAIIWGGGFVFSQMAIDAGFGAAGLLLGKFGIATVLFTLIYGRTVFRRIKPRDVVRGVLIGLLLAGSFFAQTFGLKYSSPSNCALITAAYVVITPLLWRAVNKKKLRAVIYVASALCLAGVAVLSVNFTGGFALGFGDMITLLAAVLFAGQIVATESLVADMDFRVLLFLQFATAAVCSLVVFLITEGDFSPFLDARGLLPVLYLGAFSTCLCYVFQTSAQRYVPSATAAIILAMESPFGAVFSVAAGYDRPDARLIIGAALVVLSVILPDVVRERKSEGVQSGV